MCFVDDSSLVAFVPSTGERVAVTESMYHDLNRVSIWCDLCSMKFMAGKNKAIIVSRSRTVHSQSDPLNQDGTVLK